MTRPAYDLAATYQFKTTAFPFTEAESVPATMTEAAVAAAGLATAAKQDEIIADIAAAELQAAAAAAIAAAGLATEAKQDEILADLAALDWRTQAILSGTVDTVTSNADFTIIGDFGATDDSYKQCYIQFTSGANKGIGRLIGAYTGTTKRVQFNGGGIARGAFPYTVVAGDEFILVPTSDLVVGIVGVKAN